MFRTSLSILVLLAAAAAGLPSLAQTTQNKDQQEATELLGGVDHHLTYLKLSFIAQQYTPLAKQATQKAWSHVDYLARLVEGEAHRRRDRATQSRIRLARFPVIKTLEQLQKTFPILRLQDKINALKGQEQQSQSL